MGYINTCGSDVCGPSGAERLLRPVPFCWLEPLGGVGGVVGVGRTRRVSPPPRVGGTLRGECRRLWNCAGPLTRQVEDRLQKSAKYCVEGAGSLIREKFGMAKLGADKIWHPF